jgi:hypothetical protein
MFERFTDRARRVIVLAQEEARRLDHNYIGTEHILLGLLREQDGVAVMALRSLDVSFDAVRTEVEQIIGRGTAPPEGHIPFTPRAKKALEMSLREALQLGHDYIGTEHILLGLLREGQGVGAQVLVKLGADLPSVRVTVAQLLEGMAPGATVPPAPASVRSVPRARPPMAPGYRAAERRCSFCLRSEERLGRVVRGPAGLICDECLARATTLVAEAGESDPQQLRLRRPVVPSVELEEAMVLVERAFETVFGSGASVDARLALIEDSADLRTVVERVVATGRVSGDPDVWVEHVRFISTDEAEVRWSPLLGGGTQISLHGFAVLDDGVWKVNRASYQQIASMAGAPFVTEGEPPGEEPPGEGRPA